MFKSLSDPGHGGVNDRYNIGYSGEYIEADGNLKISLAYQKELYNYEIEENDLTRYTDKSVGRSTRGHMASGYDLFCSDHTNACGDPSVTGVEGFYSVDIPGDKELVEKMCAAISAYFDIPNRGAKVRVGVNDPTEDYYTVIDKAQDSGCKHVILMEYMFHSNPDSEQILLDDDNLNIIGKIKAEVIAEHFGLVKKTDVSAWAREAWNKSVKKGINDGIGPKNTVTEEQLMVFFDKVGLLD